MLLCLAAQAEAQRPPGSQTSPGNLPPTPLSSYAVEVIRITPSGACRPTIGRQMTVFMVVRNTGTTVATNVPWEISMVGSSSRQRTVLGQGTLASLAHRTLDSIAVSATPTEPSVVLSGTVAPRGPVRANTAPVANLALDRAITVYGVQAPRGVTNVLSGAGGGGGASMGVVPANQQACP